MSNITSLVTAIGQEVQALENCFSGLYQFRNIDLSVGAQLDGIGEMAGVLRPTGMSDPDYRSLIRFQIFLNSASGTPEDVLRAMQGLTDATVIKLKEPLNALIYLYFNGTLPDHIYDRIDAIRAAGVALEMVHCDQSPLFVFGDPSPDPTTGIDATPGEEDEMTEGLGFSELLVSSLPNEAYEFQGGILPEHISQ